jgi:hypothetical protein
MSRKRRRPSGSHMWTAISARMMTQDAMTKRQIVIVPM